MSCWVCDRANGNCEHKNGNVLTPELALIIQRERTEELEGQVSALEARIAELTAERGAALEQRDNWRAAANEANAESLAARARIAELERERDAAFDALATERATAIEARADRDEAVRLLRRVKASGRLSDMLDDELLDDMDAYLARHSAKSDAPDLGPAPQTSDDPPTR